MTAQKQNQWHVRCRKPERGKIVAHLLYGDSLQVHAVAHDAQGLQTIRHQAEFLNKRGKTPLPQCRADGAKPKRNQPIPGQLEMFSGHLFEPKPTK